MNDKRADYLTEKNRQAYYDWVDRLLFAKKQPDPRTREQLAGWGQHLWRMSEARAWATQRRWQLEEAAARLLLEQAAARARAALGPNVVPFPVRRGRP